MENINICPQCGKDSSSRKMEYVPAMICPKCKCEYVTIIDKCKNGENNCPICKNNN